MHGFEVPRRRGRTVPLTPLIDVVFLLVVFFMLTSSFVLTESLELALPSVKEVKQTSKADAPIVIRMQPDKSLKVDNKRIIPEALQSTLEALMEGDANRRIVLFSAKGINIQDLVMVVDQIYKAGGRNISVLDAQGKGAF